METNETETLARLKQLATLHFQTLKPANDKSEAYIFKIKIINYFELGCLITDMLKLCILALDHDMHNIKNNKNDAINVSLILETVLQMIPMDELEFLSDVEDMVNE